MFRVYLGLIWMFERVPRAWIWKRFSRKRKWEQRLPTPLYIVLFLLSSTTILLEDNPSFVIAWLFWAEHCKWGAWLCVCTCVYLGICYVIVPCRNTEIRKVYKNPRRLRNKTWKRRIFFSSGNAIYIHPYIFMQYYAIIQRLEHYGHNYFRHWIFSQVQNGPNNVWVCKDVFHSPELNKTEQCHMMDLTYISKTASTKNHE